MLLWMGCSVNDDDDGGNNKWAMQNVDDIFATSLGSPHRHVMKMMLQARQDFCHQCAAVVFGPKTVPFSTQSAESKITKLSSQ